jgi:NO-binding membrane sensor protein with MHYT domain
MDSYNFVLVVLSFFLSVLGSFMALLVTRAALEKRGTRLAY